MPPRKKTKLSSRPASSPSVGTPKETTPAAASKVSQEVTRPVLDPDPWTDDQEAALFKNIVRYKPVGLHKHTRMICILTNLRRYGWQEDHISRNGVWQKLDTLYNMETLDEREDADELEQDDEQVEFWLPSADFGEAMFSRRISIKGSASPPTLHHQLSYRSGLDVSRRGAAGDRKSSLSEAAHKSSPEPEWESGRDGEKRSQRGRGARGRGASKAQTEVSTRKRKRAETPPQEEEGQEEDESAEEEVEDDEEGENEEDDEDEDQGEEEGDEEEDDDDEEGEAEESDEEEAERSAPANRGARGRSTRTNPKRGRGGSGAVGSGGRGGGGKTRGGGRGGKAAPRGRTARGGRARGR